MKITSYAYIILFAISCSPNSQESKESGPDAINQRFFDLFNSNENSAMDYIFSTNQSLSQAETADVKQKLNSFVSQLGKFHGQELITTKGIGKNFVLFSYMVHYDRQPIRLIFIYYKAKDKWQLQNFQFDYDFEAELKEASNAYRLIQNFPTDEKN